MYKMPVVSGTKDTWKGDLGYAANDFAVGEIATACWRSTLFSDSMLVAFSSSLVLFERKYIRHLILTKNSAMNQNIR